MFHKLTKMKIIINEIWRVLKIFDSAEVIAYEALSSILWVFFLSGRKLNHILVFINGRSEKY